MLKQTFRYDQFNELDLLMTFYSQDTHSSDKATLLYFHGGGLIYGDRDDLPESYCLLLVENGYNLLTIDYPLAPEVKLTTIEICLKKVIDWFLTNYQSALALEKPDYFLFGRSAGGFLAYLLSAHHKTAAQRGLISFYGYYDLTVDSFIQPSTYYNKFPKVTPMTAQTMIQAKPVTSASINGRFSLYLSGRQYGNWLSYLLNSPSEKLSFSLTDNELSNLPPTFLAHSNGDQDVPVAFSREAEIRLPHVTYKEIEKLPHDFDSDLMNAEGLRIYQLLINWLDHIMSIS